MRHFFIRTTQSLFLLSALICFTACAAEDQFNAVWIDTETNQNVRETVVTAHDLGLPGSWTIEKHRLHGGKQEGIDLVLLNNGKLQILIVPTRGMSIWYVNCGDVRLGWDSPVGQIIHPQFVNLEARNGLGWLDGFGGWFVRCGLEYAGAPGVDEIISNTGSVIEVPLTLHGKIDYTPANKVEVAVDKDPPHKLYVRGTVRECYMFGPNLELTTEISTIPGTNSFTVRDKVTNKLGKKSEMMLIEHLNFGAPLLEKGSKLIAPIERVTPRDERAAEAKPEDIFVYQGPIPGYVEQVFYLKPLANEENQTELLLKNEAGDRGAAIRYNVEQLPALTLWKNTVARQDGYATGIEPGLNYANNRRVERKHGRVPELKPGESREFTLHFEIAMDEESVKAAEKRVNTIKGDQSPTFDSEPVEGISF